MSRYRIVAIQEDWQGHLQHTGWAVLDTHGDVIVTPALATRADAEAILRWLADLPDRLRDQWTDPREICAAWARDCSVR